MKKVKYISLWIGTALLLCTGFASCSDEETYDFPGDPYNRVYTTDHSSDGKIVKTPIGVVSFLECNIPAKCNRKADSDIAVTFSIDNSLIDSYNEANGTECMPFPADLLEIENTTIIIPKGEMISSEEFIIRLTDNEAKLNTVDKNNLYLVPVRISQISGGNAALATSVSSISYFKISMTEKLINEDATSCKGTLLSVDDRADWTVSYINNTSDVTVTTIRNAFNDNEYNACGLTSSSAFDAVIDMGKTYSFDGFVTSYYSRTFLDSGPVFYSVDGTTWIELGVSSKVNTYLFAPISARYLKYYVPLKQTWSGMVAYTYICNFNIYATN